VHLSEQALEKGTYLMGKLNRKQRDLPLIGEVRGSGLMIGIELVSDEKRTPAPSEAEAVRQHCMAKGVLVGVGGVYGNVVRIQPPLVISREQIDRAVEVVSAGIEQLQTNTAAAGR
jgi:4-aminobutyrate aminotransferase-like enzyme